jgi:hypothetical protein
MSNSAVALLLSQASDRGISIRRSAGDPVCMNHPRPNTPDQLLIAVTAEVDKTTVRRYFDPTWLPRLKSSSVKRIERALRKLRWSKLIQKIETPSTDAPKVLP